MRTPFEDYCVENGIHKNTVWGWRTNKPLDIELLEHEWNRANEQAKLLDAIKTSQTFLNN